MGEVLCCCWCDGRFLARQTGGRAQRFCQPSCRRAFHSAARNWALDAIAIGTLTVPEIRSGAAATRALVRLAASSAPIDDAARRSPTPVAPRAESRYTPQETLERAMAQAIAMRRR
jgi:hypothetical protein